MTISNDYIDHHGTAKALLTAANGRCIWCPEFIQVGDEFVYLAGPPGAPSLIHKSCRDRRAMVSV